MSWRTVIISSRCKLDLKMGYLVARGEEVKRIFLDEIALLLIENPAVAMTGCLLSALTEKKIKVIFCDQKHMPQSELVPVRGSFDSARKIKAQISWDEMVKGCVWGEIIRQKIYQQAVFLSQLGFERERGLLDWQETEHTITLHLHRGCRVSLEHSPLMAALAYHDSEKGGGAQ